MKRQIIIVGGLIAVAVATVTSSVMLNGAPAPTETRTNQQAPTPTLIVDEVTPEQMVMNKRAQVLVKKAEPVIGMTEDAAKNYIEGLGLIWRVVHRDAEPIAVTTDLRMDRIDGYIDDGVVKRVTAF